MSDADIKHHLAEYCAAFDAEDWVKVVDDQLLEGCDVLWRKLGSERTWVRTSTEIPVPYSNYAQVHLPEIVCAHPALGAGLYHWELVEHLAPGDCLVKMRINNEEIAAAASMMIGNGGLQDANLRVSQHDNVPRPGETTQVMVSLGSDQLNFAALGAFFVRVRPGRTNDSTIEEVVFQTPWNTYPEWFTRIATIIHEVTQQHSAKLKIEVPRYIPLAADFYKILALRSCSRGLPLLPQDSYSEATTVEKIGGYYWYAREDEMPFPTYLQKMLRVCGSDARVFNTLQGQRLVPYQAVVLAEEWRKIEGAVKRLFAFQCSAYRLLRGGSIAPKLRTDMVPRFASGSDRQPLPAATKLSVHDLMVFKIENKTFLEFHFAQDSFAINLPSGKRKAAEAP